MIRSLIGSAVASSPIRLISFHYTSTNLIHHIRLNRSYCTDSRLKGLLYKMPKDPKAAREMKQQRIKKAEKLQHLTSVHSGKVSLHVLGNGGPGNPSVLYVMTDHHRYFFNCGEGAQRLATEHGYKISKLDRVFLTRVGWNTIGGLPGLSMTLQGIGVPKVNVHSPSPIIDLYQLTRLFSVSAELDVQQHLSSDAPFYEDVDMKVTYVPLMPSPKTPDESVVKRSKTEQNPVSLCYVCKLGQVAGRLNIRKCMNLKVPNGPLLGKLKDGEDITLEDGSIVKSSDVIEPAEPSPYFLIIDCPTEETVETLVSHEAFAKFLNPQSDDDIAPYVFHFSPPSVTNHPKYQDWVQSFPSSTFHFVLNESNPNLAYLSSATFQLKLNRLDETIFPSVTTDFNHESDPDTDNRLFKSVTGTKIDLRPKTADKFVLMDGLVKFDPTSALEEFFTDETNKSIEIYKEKVAKMSSPMSHLHYPKVTFLGTASACPGKDRCTSFIFIQISESTSMIFDCGEGSYGQLFRFFGPDEVKEQLKKIKCIFISHLHADHHLGLITILTERAKLTSEPITLICPNSVKKWLTDYDEKFGKVAHTFVHRPNEQMISRTDYPFFDSLDLNNLQTVRVKHCRDSFGITITTKDYPFKIVYSGDCMPSDFLVGVGKDCDLLIHEATMEDDLEDEARIKCHCTISQAIEIGVRMEAKYTILTHFSQRYAKIPMISEGVFDKHRVGCAFDNMMVSRGDLDRMVAMNEPLRSMFVEYEEQLVERNRKRKERSRIVSQLKEEGIIA